MMTPAESMASSSAAPPIPRKSGRFDFWAGAGWGCEDSGHGAPMLGWCPDWAGEGSEEDGKLGRLLFLSSCLPVFLFKFRTSPLGCGTAALIACTAPPDGSDMGV